MNKSRVKNIFAILILILAIIKLYSVFFGIDSYSKYIMFISIFLSTILIFYSRKSYKFFHYFLLMISAMQFIISKNVSMFYTIYLCLAFIEIDFKMLAKFFLIANSLLFAIYLTFNLFGYYPTEYLDGRNDFGFGNPNTAFICMFLVWVSYFYFIYNSRKKLDYFVLFFLVFITYTQTETRTGLLAAFSTLVCYFILIKVDVRKKHIAMLFAMVPIIATIISVILALFLFDNYLINSILSSRPLYWNAYLLHNTHGLNLFGYPANIRDLLFTIRTPLDSGYIWTMYSQGVISYFIFLLALSISIYTMCKKNKKAEILLIFGILVYCFAESIMLDISTNVCLILMIQNIGELNLYNKLMSTIRKNDIKEMKC